jgi:hypothetical protein
MPSEPGQPQKELIDGAPDLVVAQNTAMVAALLEETRSVPIVFVNVADPVGNGFVTSVPRPGGNVTGFTGYEPWAGIYFSACCRDWFVGYQSRRSTRQ